MFRTISNIWANRGQVMGMNQRNLSYISRYNKPDDIANANDKVKTKAILEEAGVSVAKTLFVINNPKQINKFDFNKLPKSFVIKPAHGLDGLGIEIFFNRNKQGNFIQGNKRVWTEQDILRHFYNILEGQFSHKHAPDKILVEERIQPSKSFRHYTQKGTPDIRVLLFKSVPIMAFVRWPTKSSQGKANMFLGAVGSGIDMSTGTTTYSVSGKHWFGKGYEVEYVEDSNLRYSGFKVPYWDSILKNSVKAAKAMKLGYCAVDFLVDSEKGAVVVEVNARPGLSIQLTNDDGLAWRCKKIKGLKIKSETHAINLAKNLFGGEVEEEVEAITGKKLIGLIENVKIFSKTGKSSMIVKAKIDTGAGSTSIDTQLAKKLGYGGALETFEKYKNEIPEKIETEVDRLKVKNIESKMIEENPEIYNITFITSSSGQNSRLKVRGKIILAGIEKEAFLNIIDRKDLAYPVIIGQKDMKGFIVDPRKKI